MPRISAIKLPATFARDGLQSVEMTGLGSVVVLAGRNGAGKSRLLNRVQQAGPKHAEVRSVREQLDRVTRALDQSPEREDLHRAAAKYREQLRDAPIVEGTESQCGRIVIVPGNLHRSFEFTEHQRRGQAESVARFTGGLAGMDGAALSYIREVVDGYVRASSAATVATPEAREAARKRFADLDRLVEALLGARLELSIEPPCSIFGFGIDEANLSPGQSGLLQIAVGLHAKGLGQLHGQVLLWDEPEKQLHPAAVLEAFDRLLTAVSPNDGQLWIATHSIHLLAHVDPKSIWYVEKGAVTRAGSSASRVLESLLGDQAQIERLARFLLLPAEHAAVLFATQCLSGPEVLGETAQDPQGAHVARLLETLRNERPSRQLQLLDYGAGTGRLVDYILPEGLPSDRLVYSAYERDPDCRALLGQTLSKRNGAGRVLDDDGLRSLRGGTARFDVVLMCNVLHEIDPIDWERDLGLVCDVLADDGFLVVIEDQLMPIGERAHPSGFLVLGRSATTRLFQCDSDPDFRFETVAHGGNPGRISAATIPARCLAGVDRTRVSAAVEEIRDTADSRLRQLEMSGGSPDLKSGRAYAFQTFQFANATRALVRLRGISDLKS